ncbi:prevent-host-death family protein [Actinomyces ruminicola]|uniref:Antitoxin n=1 Tax=Actinomyces ruminicola TaxID=332524 RepID=A0A1H0AT22_9ACTO|nr:type II toxin-antitoxin system Phd/YefM family antitoxin [Actinomyces ruminicola]SDN36459.1 prevent-host-death family protein [Actinomyces ruminicola]
MMATTMSSREFNQNVSSAKRASRQGPVLITDRGVPAHVLLSIEDYRRLTSANKGILEALSMPGLSEIELDIEPTRDLPRAAELD